LLVGREGQILQKSIVMVMVVVVVVVVSE